MVGNILVIDGGRTHCRAAVSNDGQRSGYCEGPGLVPGAGPAGVAEALGALTSELLRSHGPVVAACAGLAGMLAEDVRAETAERLSRTLGVRTTVTGDAVIAHAGALGGGPGVVVVAGTGAVALGAGPAGTWRSDGWGHLLGDAGSGYWIGRRALDAALRAADGRGGSALLARMAEAHLGPLDTLAVRLVATADATRTVAGFAEAVAVAAHTGDDPVARTIWWEAATELATSAAACAARSFPPGTVVPVSWAGGVFDAPESLLLRPFLDQLEALLPETAPASPAGDALSGAARLLAPDGPGVLAPLVHTVAAPITEPGLCAPGIPGTVHY